MKQPKKPNLRQKKILKARKYNPDNWMVVKEEPDYIQIINKTSGKIRELET